MFTRLSPAQTQTVRSMIRVNQAGELGADLILAGQRFVFAHSKPSLVPVLDHMWDQEKHHRATFNGLQTEARVRPSVLTPLWKAAALGVGVGSALVGKEAAMACTEAIETVIGGHYNSQLRWLAAEFGQDAPKDVAELQQTIARFRDDELEHLDTAVAHDSHRAVPYQVISEVVKAGCRTAIWLAKRV